MPRTIDIFGVRPDRTAEAVRQLREAQNVLSSYTHALDLLAEALQNATDAVDSRSEADSEAPRRIHIEFDVPARRFAVTDTGTGMAERALEVVLTPNVSLKSGDLAPARSRRSRGEKGVGLSFLMLACNRLAIQTCDGSRRLDLVVENANRWVASDGRDAAVPRGKLSDPKPADAELESQRYTRVELTDIDADQFDSDLFEFELAELIWQLRTRTAVGNTASLFADLGRDQPVPIDVTLDYRDADGQWHEDQEVDYSYASPEEWLDGFDELDDVDILDLRELDGATPVEMARRTQGRAVRFTRRVKSRSGYLIDIYVLAMDGRAMAARLEALETEGYWVPDEWQGFWVATRDMPTGVPLQSGLISPRTLERRLFMLVQFDGLVLDLGRKTLAGRTRGMLNEAVKTVWEDVLRRVVPRIGPANRTPTRATIAALQNHVRRARGLPDLEADVPYLKQPDKTAGVMALFHELLVAERGTLPTLRTLTSGVFRTSDALVYMGEPNGDLPLHVAFSLAASELVGELEQDERSAATVRLAVVWSLGEKSLRDAGVDIEELDDSPDGATHELIMHGMANRDTLRVMALEHVVHLA